MWTPAYEIHDSARGTAMDHSIGELLRLADCPALTAVFAAIPSSHGVPD